MAASRDNCDWDRSLNFQLAMPAADMATTKPLWIPAHTQGCCRAPGWLYTSWGASTPMMPWWRSTKPMAARKGRQSW